ncbi:right-handed parallel beta-helix repeat-containing protein [Hymenobacter sp. BRD67]|uniref:right-handed parallel beta-helix repeat-containing protein n=1 Tax=Hymenobacter sp. BRD67 TaxID=2675877 RepID=UPI0015664BA6|nr:right-handed parallel beta-helix repeat-containing protein [Hymenobacter sp. BRD67]QKG53544.1 right-handed parallel beta-helix repeat-containing protein [Hymenobacter sp. BRD67]
MSNSFTRALGGLALGLLALTSCKKTESLSITAAPQPSSHPITSTTLSGNLKGTLLSSVGTYTMSGDVHVALKDTLYVQKGVTINVTNNSAFFVDGNLIVEGTAASPVTFTSPLNKKGSWGGFQCDSAQSVSIKWAHINYAGGPNATGSPRGTIRIAPKSPKQHIKVTIQDSWLLSGTDDGISLFGGGVVVDIQRNTIGDEGTTDGDAINLKSGATGVVAYNVLWNGAGTAIKLETSPTVLYPQTNVTVNNNTIVASGYRRGAGEPGRAISADKFAQGAIFNNLIVNDYYGLDINPVADVKNVIYGYNYFYTAVDSTRKNFYPAGSIGKPQPTDIISTSKTDKDPMFVKLSATTDPSQGVDPNDYHLQAGSPAKGKGNPTYNNDIGAYTSDDKGNKH